MNKKVITFFTIVFMMLGSYMPVMLGADIFNIWGIVGGFVGGIFGIWVGVVVSKRFF